MAILTHLWSNVYLLFRTAINASICSLCFHLIEPNGSSQFLFDGFFLLVFVVIITNIMFVQVEYVHMETEQREAYTGSIEEYRAFANARMLNSGQVNNTSLPKRQISNYFVQFRKVLLRILFL